MTTAGSSPQRSTLWPLVGLGLLFLLITFNLWWYLGSSEYSCLASENAKHMAKAYEMYHRLNQGEALSSVINTITYPPLFYLTTQIFYYGCNLRSEAVTIFSVLPYLLLTAGAFYGICGRLTGQAAALTGTAVLLVLSSLALTTEGYIIEFALMAWVTVSLFFLIKSQAFSKPWPCFCLGLCWGCGLLYKWTFVVYAIFPVLYIAWFIWHNQLEDRQQRLLQATLALLIALSIATPWYLASHAGISNLNELFGHFFHSQSSELIILAQQENLYTFRDHLPYLLQFGPLAFVCFLVSRIIPLPLSLLLLWGLGSASQRLWKKPHSPDLAIILTGLLGSLIFFSLYPTPLAFTPEKSLRHLAAITPQAIIMAVYGWDSFKKWQIVPIILLSVLAFTGLMSWKYPGALCLPQSFYAPSLPPSLNHRFQDPLGLTSSALPSRLETLCANYAELSQQQHLPILIDFPSLEDFDPFLTVLYSQIGRRLVICRRGSNCQYLDSLTQTDEGPADPDLIKRGVILVRRNFRPYTAAPPYALPKTNLVYRRGGIEEYSVKIGSSF